MKIFRQCMRLACALLPATSLAAEEVLSTRPLIIAPRRIEVSPAPQPSPDTPAIQSSRKFPILRLGFRRGSMRLSKKTSRALRELHAPKSGLRITGYGDTNRPDEKLANLRARAVASFLEEYAGIREVEILWQAEAFAEPGIGATVEERQ